MNGAPVSQADVDELAKKLMTALGNDDPTAATQLFDWDGLIDMAAASAASDPGMPAEKIATFVSDFRKGVMSTTQKTGGVLGQWRQLVRSGATPKIVWATAAGGGEPSILIRIMHTNSGVSYLEMFVGRASDSRECVRDILPWETGERTSSVFRRTFHKAIATTKGLGANAKLKEFSNDFAILGKMAELSGAGRFAEVLQLTKSLSPAFQNDRVVLVLRMTAASNIEDKGELQAAVAAVRKNFPNDTSFDLALLDPHLTLEQFDLAVGCLERLEKRASQDGHIKTLAGNILYAAKRYDESRKKLLEAIEIEPDLVAPYQSLMSVALAQNDFKELRRMLEVQTEKFGTEWADLTKIPEYADFVKSEEYREWKAGATKSE
ncbi:MAG: hypothetical protein NT069_25510 [Planctomycetota bacterium]|nr:hypothetical protein [Planctomycetota bacterium]